MKKSLLLSLLTLCFLGAKAQDLVHYWHFNNVTTTIDSVAADFTVASNAPLIIYQKSYQNVANPGYMDDVTGDALNARNSEPAGNGIRPRNPSDSMELFIQLPSTGYKDLMISYAVQRSGSGMLKQVIYYTTDGTNYMAHPDTIFINTAWELKTVDFTGMTAIDDNADFAVKIKFFEQNTASNGNNRIDNFAFEGTPLNTSLDIINYWHFNTVNGTIDSVQADYSLLANAPWIIYREAYPNVSNPGYMDDVNGDALNSRMSEPAGNGIRPRNPSDSMELVLQLPTTGFTNIHLSYVAQRSGSGMLKQVLYYSTDGVNFTAHPDTVNVTTTFSLVNFDFSGIPAASNNPNFTAKILFFEQNVASNGNNRLDNVVLEGTSLGAAVQGVTINPSNASVLIGDNVQLMAMINPGNATNKTVTWSTSNASIASVDADGLVTGVAAGNASIIVTTQDGGFSDTAMIEVLAPKVLTIEVMGAGSALGGAKVSIDGDEKTTDANGSVVFELNTGMYEVHVSADGFIPNTSEITLNADTTVVIDLKEMSEEVIHYWHFNDMPLGTVTDVEADYTLTPDTKPVITYEGVGNGYMDDYSPGSDLNAQFGNPPGIALRVRNRSHEKALIIPLPANGSQDIMLSFDIHRSGSGMLINHFEYTLDGTTYQNTGIVPQQIDVTETYTRHVIDFSAVTGANDNPNFGVRITWEGNTEQDNGNNRYDNIAMIASTELDVSVEKVNENRFEIYPNPSNGTLFIKNVEAGATYRILNKQGALVKTGRFSSDNEMISLSSNIANGLYFIQIEHSNTVAVQKIILQR